jgi:hypothetical protein
MMFDHCWLSTCWGGAVATIGLCGVLASAALAQSLPVQDPSTVGCVIALADGDSPTSRAAEDRTLSPGGGTPEAAVLADALRPPREAEVDQLGAVLEALAKAESAANALAGLAKGQPFSVARFGVLLADVRSIVVRVHAQELRDQLNQSPKIGPENRKWVLERINRMESCAAARFQTRGGSAALDQAAAFVARKQSQLEPLLFPTPDAATQPSSQGVSR